MENNCLVTKLKGTVDNDNLPIFGAFTLQITEQQSPNQNTQYIDVSGGTIITPSEYPMTDANHLANGTYKVLVKNKYDITRIWFRNAIQQVNLSDLKYCTKVNYFFSDNGAYGDISNIANWDLNSSFYVGANSSPSLTGDIGVFKNFPSLREITLAGSGVSGDISQLSNLQSIVSLNLLNCKKIQGDITEALGNKTNLKTVYINGTGITGEIIDFVAAQVAAGRTTKEPSTVSWGGFLTQLTFGGEIRESVNGYTYVSWDGTKIVVYFGAQTAGYQKAIRIYAKNATQQEISDWQAAGKQVIVIS